MSISSTFIRWYLQKKRNLPWRDSQNPYEIWVSEVVMQQTRVAQGLEYYNRFIERFPTIESLARADIEDVLKLWQGLGYYSRARNIHEGAKHVLQHYSGNLPPNHKQLLTIKGIGQYTAAAIASFAYNLPYPVVDGNVNRVLSRIYGVFEPINSTTGQKKIHEIASSIIDVQNPALHNQAIMEFGALQCKPGKPDCSVCPLTASCHAFIYQKTLLLPVKLKKQPVKNRYFTYLLFLYHNNIVLQKRTSKDIWEGLYEFPLQETEKWPSPDIIPSSLSPHSIFEGHATSKTLPLGIFQHQLTHQKISARFVHITLGSLPKELSNQYVVIAQNDIVKYPVSKLIENYLTEIRLI